MNAQSSSPCEAMPLPVMMMTTRNSVFSRAAAANTMPPAVSSSSSAATSAASSATTQSTAVEMPRRPLSAYNLFFQSERKRLIAKTCKNPEELAKLQQMERPSKDRKKKRPHCKTHGIGFAKMARHIAKTWKALDPEARAFYEDGAKKDKLRYQRELDEWRNSQKVEAEKAGMSAGTLSLLHPTVVQMVLKNAEADWSLRSSSIIQQQGQLNKPSGLAATTTTTTATAGVAAASVPAPPGMDQSLLGMMVHSHRQQHEQHQHQQVVAVPLKVSPGTTGWVVGQESSRENVSRDPPISVPPQTSQNLQPVLLTSTATALTNALEVNSNNSARADHAYLDASQASHSFQTSRIGEETSHQASLNTDDGVVGYHREANIGGGGAGSTESWTAFLDNALAPTQQSEPSGYNKDSLASVVPVSPPTVVTPTLESSRKGFELEWTDLDQQVKKQDVDLSFLGSFSPSDAFEDDLMFLEDIERSELTAI